MHLRRSTILALALIASSAGCDDATGPDGLTPSVLISDFNEDTPQLYVVKRSGRIDIAFTTYRNSCTAPAGEDVSVAYSEHTITVHPYDRPDGGLCFPELEREIRVASAAPLFGGVWTIRVVGVRTAAPADPAHPYDPVTVETEVTLP